MYFASIFIEFGGFWAPEWFFDLGTMFLELNFDSESIPDGFKAIRDLSGELRAICGPKTWIFQKVSTWSNRRIHTNLGYDCSIYFP